MPNLKTQAKVVLEENYEEIKTILGDSQANYATANQLQTDNVDPKSLGKVLTYLVEQGEMETWERSGPNLYDLNSYNPSDLQELKKELD